MILDSSYLIDLMNDDDGAAAKLEEIADERRPTAISTLTVVEVGTGITNPSTRNQFDQLTDEMAVIPLNQSAAQRAVEIQRLLESEGKRIGNVDAMIAATALERNEGVVTRNLSEFRRVDGLSVHPY